MRKTIFQRIGSGLLSLLMMSTLAISPALAADSRPEPSAASTQAASDFTITPVGTVTADSTQAVSYTHLALFTGAGSLLRIRHLCLYRCIVLEISDV